MEGLKQLSFSSQVCSTPFRADGINLRVGDAPSKTQRLGATPTVKMLAGKGFGVGSKSVRKEAPSPSKGKTVRFEKLEGMGKRKIPCPCGGGEEKNEFSECCARYHGGVKEPDALTLMKARYSAFAKGIVPYLVRTTHDDHPDLKNGGRKQLEKDCLTTCERLIFKRIEILSSEQGSTEWEAFVSFRVTYAYKQGVTEGDLILVEKSRFVRSEEDGRWFYREKIEIDNLSQAAWKYGALLEESSGTTQPKFKLFGRAQPHLVRKKTDGS